MTNSQIDRAMGALMGGALGDAMGMPTQLFSPAQISAEYGFVDTFLPPTADHPASRGLAAGTVTDDTEQAILLARNLIANPEKFDHRKWADTLIDWETDVKQRGSFDLLGPSTKKAIEAIRNGQPVDQAGMYGDTNGAAMRITPVGIMLPPFPMADLVKKVAETCLATHNTTIAIAAASAVAAAVSCGIEGGDWEQAIRSASPAARNGARHGYWAAGPDIASRIDWAISLVDGLNEDEARRRIVDLVGTSVASQESVPAAFAVVQACAGDPMRAAVLSANLGGDTDTIGAIACSIAGACMGLSKFSGDWIGQLNGISYVEIERISTDLIGLRMKSSAASVEIQHG